HVLKRQGTPIQYSSVAKPNGRTILTLEKIGKGLCYCVNNQQVIEYYDVDLNENEESFFSIGLRIGYTLKINRIMVESDSLSQVAEIEMVAETLKKPRRNYSMLRMGYTNLGKRFPTVEAYLINDVTSIQAKADTYKLQYEAGLRKSSELETKLRKLTKRETVFVGNTPAILKIKETAASVADFDVSVLIQGPTGTGKEILAKSIHEKSRRSKFPFMKVDCSAMPEALIESELFGHEKGAFTGAHEARSGRFEQANRGTIFIDEIGNLNMQVQAKLLGFLQDHTISRIGGHSIELDVRIIAATNVPMEVLIREGKMRSDLFYRLNTVVLNIPPLKKRVEDIPLLITRFLVLANEQYGKNILSISRNAMDLLLSHEWPGNVRELENVIVRAYMFCDNTEITEKDIVLNDELRPHGAIKKGGTRLKNMSKEKMVELLKKNNNIIAGVARELNISRQACYVNMRKLGIETTSFRLK
ncbi:MAG: sigma-54-dependent Fis family transcriptional regulator, partial [Fibrobacteres bacterium]|nr:sigma-54-dependent Fis family transcriptional regulator [Fibrobacterota bacterium]